MDEALIQDIKDATNVDDICYEPDIATNIDCPVLVLINFATDLSNPPLSVILPINSHENMFTTNKIWMNIKHTHLKLINNQRPRHHSSYKTIEYQGIVYEPYSVNTASYSKTADDIKKLLESLYCHCIFGE